MYLDYATRQARRHIPMTMEDWKTKLDAFLRFNDAEVLPDKGKVTEAIAKEFAESEFEKYRVIQDSLYESDFDKLMNDMEKDGTICGESNGVISFEKVNKKGRRYKLCCQQEKKH